MKTINVTVLVEHGFVPTELALMQDTLRIAERLEPNFRCVLRLCTTQRETAHAGVEGLGGMLVRAEAFDAECAGLPDYVVVLGGAGIAAAFGRARMRLVSLERMGVNIILLSDAAAAWRNQNMQADDLTAHWENELLARDAGRSFRDNLPLFVRKSRITTGGGMVSTVDLILKQLIEPVSPRLAQSIAQTMLIGGIRDGMTMQPRSQNDVLAFEHAKLAPIVSAMERAVEDPLSTQELATIGGFSVRQLERKFRTHLNQSPVAFYRSLRLRRAKQLIEQTALSVTEISVACGFGNSSGFSKTYAREFGISPTKRRAQLASIAPVRAMPQQQDVDSDRHR